ncbi:hypothetical protein F4810DRAFT_24725 [Camillea tinctor]|nr:hypothetical protein F4810DRAFT_24725 [Camillea tinctor]
MSSARLLLLRRIRPVLPGLATGTGLGLLALGPGSSRPLRMDARAAPRQSALEKGDNGTLSPGMMRQLSGGSIAGLLTGVLVTAFSRTLVLILGISIVVVQIASRYGIDLMRQLKVKERLGYSRILAALEEDPVYKLSFGLFFTMSAFMQLDPN